MIERRDTHRRRTYLGAQIRVPFQRSDTACLVRDLTATGARIAVSRTILLPDRFDLAIQWREECHRAEIVWREGDMISVRFLNGTGNGPSECEPTLH